MKRKIGLSTFALQREYGDKRALEIAAEVGADAVDFGLSDDLCDYRSPVSIYSKSDDEIVAYYTGLREYAEGLGLVINQTHGRGSGLMNDREKDAAILANARIDCMATAALGASVCVVHNPTLICLGPDPDPEMMRDLSFQMFSGMIPHAKRYGVKIATETFGDAVLFNSVDFFGDIHEFEDSYNRVVAVPEFRDHITVCVDTGHSNKAMRYGNPTPADVIRRMGRAVTVLHLHDNDTLTDQHKIPQTGCIDWNDVFSALEEIGFDGVYNLELNLKHFGEHFMIETAEFGVKVMRNFLNDRYGG